jgi:hypothetical protein
MIVHIQLIVIYHGSTKMRYVFPIHARDGMQPGQCNGWSGS